MDGILLVTFTYFNDDISLADIEIKDDNLFITTREYGHGGIHQYGANAMTKVGYSYEEIIKYYFAGVSIVKF